MKITQHNGYSNGVANRYIDNNKPVYSISVELDSQYRWEDGQPTSKVVGYKAWFTQEGLPPFSVKFSDEIDLPKYMSIVEFEGLEGCEIKNNVYFRATSVKKIK